MYTHIFVYCVFFILYIAKSWLTLREADAFAAKGGCPEWPIYLNEGVCSNS